MTTLAIEFMKLIARAEISRELNLPISQQAIDEAKAAIEKHEKYIGFYAGVAESVDAADSKSVA